jgi:hypothetical protein
MALRLERQHLMHHGMFESPAQHLDCSPICNICPPAEAPDMSLDINGQDGVQQLHRTALPTP